MDALYEARQKLIKNLQKRHNKSFRERTFKFEQRLIHEVKKTKIYELNENLHMPFSSINEHVKRE